MTRPLAGIKVIDLSYYVAGPGCAKILSDWGADVIKVEPLCGEPGRATGEQLGLPCTETCNPYFHMYNDGKRFIRVDLKKAEGIVILRRLLEQADVLITNFRPKALERLGLDYDTIHVRYPRLVWAGVSGYGNIGPDRDKAGFDTVAYWARSGAMLSLREKGDTPINPTLAFGDSATSCSLAGGICAALYQRHRTGQGCKVSASLLAQAAWQMGPVIMSAQYGDRYPKTRREPNSPFVNTYRSNDGKWFFLCIIDDRMIPIFLEQVLKRPDLARDPRYNSTASVRERSCELTGIMSEAFGSRTFQELSDCMKAADIAYEELARIENVLMDHQLLMNGDLEPYCEINGDQLLQVQPPVRFVSEGNTLSGKERLEGTQTEEILQELGYSETETAGFVREGVVMA